MKIRLNFPEKKCLFKAIAQLVNNILQNLTLQELNYLLKENINIATGSQDFFARHIKITLKLIFNTQVLNVKSNQRKKQKVQ